MKTIFLYSDIVDQKAAIDEYMEQRVEIRTVSAETEWDKAEDQRRAAPEETVKSAVREDFVGAGAADRTGSVKET